MGLLNGGYPALGEELGEEGVEAFLGRISDIADRSGAEVRSTGQLVDKKGRVSPSVGGWSVRRLAYAINDFNEAYFVVAYLSGPSGIVEPIEQWLRLNEDVLRYLIVQAEESAANALAEAAVAAVAEAEARAAAAAEADRWKRARVSTPPPTPATS